MGTSSEEVGDGNCTSSGTGTRRVTDSVMGVWYDPSVGGDDGDDGGDDGDDGGDDGDDEGDGDEASCLWSISSAYDSSEVARRPQRHNPRSLDSTCTRRMVSSTSWLLI